MAILSYRTLGRRHLALVLALFAIAVAGLGTGFFLRQRAQFRTAARTELQTIADLKVAGVARWRQERLGDAQWILEASSLPGRARDFFDRPDNAARRADLLRWMNGWRRDPHFNRVLLLDRELRIWLSAPAGAEALEPAATAAVQAAFQEGRVTLADLHRRAADGRVVMDLAVPLLTRDGPAATVGALVLEIDPRDFLFPEIQGWPTPSKTAETLLVRREGDEVVYLNELRHRAGTALNLRLPITAGNVPAVRAALGESGIVEGPDYRGRPVLAAMGVIPNSPWSMVAKQDLAEIDEPVRQWAWLLGVAVTVLIGAGVAGVGLVWRTREVHYAREEMAERSRAEAEVHRREAELRALYSAMTEMVAIHEIVTDAAGRLVDYRILDCNLAYERITGIPRERAMGQLASTLYGTGTPPYLEIFGRVAVTGEPAALDVYFPPMGKHFAISVVSLGRGHFATVSTDITERQQLMVERERLLRELEHKNDELETMMYAASHDLRAPLVNVQGFSQRLEKACAELAGQRSAAADGTPVAERIAKALFYIRTSAAKMNGLIDGLLHVSRLGRITVKPQPVDMNQLLREVAATLEHQMQQAAAAVEIATLPPCRGDAALLSEVFANLLDNALKYREPGTPLRITVSGRVEETEVVYCVADTGRGIAAGHQDKIWEMFHRLHPDGPVKGEGLGLKIVRRILDRHHGRIWLESSPGSGSRFLVALPRLGPGEPLARETAPQTKGPGGQGTRDQGTRDQETKRPRDALQDSTGSQGVPAGKEPGVPIE